MWDRTILKSNAKIALRGKYWQAFLACLLAAVIIGGLNFVTFQFNWNYTQMMTDPIYYARDLAPRHGLHSFLSLLEVLYGIFIGAPIVIGLATYFVRNHFGVTDVGMVFSGFRRDYMNGVGTMFLTNLFISLWTLLLVIPGIVKLVQYSMVPFILSDNPSLPGSRARQISRMMTDGQKGAIFVLWLSFLGWFILGSLAFGIGNLFVFPYYSATISELYLFLRDRVIRSGMAQPFEFGLVPPSASGPVNF